MLADLIGCELASLVGNERNIYELRMRINRPLVAIEGGSIRRVVVKNGVPYIVRRQDIESVLARATNMSLYSVSEEIKRGYIPCRHYRIGVGGEGINENGSLIGIKNIAYLVIRIPHQLFRIADELIEDVLADGIRNTLVVSPTGGGKTTMLRELARLASFRYNVVIIDERYELCAMANGEPSLDIGDADVICGVAKDYAYESAVRAMNPDIIVTDELFGKRELEAIADAMRCGVRVFASVHASGIQELESCEYARLPDMFECVLVLGKNPVGSIVEKRIK